MSHSSIRLALVLICLGAVGCQPRAVEPAQPAVPPSAGTAVAQPAAPTGDAVLDTFLAELAAEIDARDWGAVTSRIEPAALGVTLLAGTEAGLSERAAEARAAAHALGLRPFVSLASPLEALDRVRVVTLRTVFAMNDVPGTLYRIEGDVRLDDGMTMPLAFELGRVDGVYLIVPQRGPVDR